MIGKGTYNKPFGKLIRIKLKNTMGRLNIKSAVKDIANIVEMQEQAELGIAHDNVPISFYSVRAVMEVAEALEIADDVKKYMNRPDWNWKTSNTNPDGNTEILD